MRAQALAASCPAGCSPVAAYRLLEVVADAPACPGAWTRRWWASRPKLAAPGCSTRAVAQEACQLVTVVGDPGVGKSRLLQAFAERTLTERALVLEAACPGYGVSAATRVAGQIIAAAAPGDRRAWPAEVAATDRKGCSGACGGCWSGWPPTARWWWSSTTCTGPTRCCSTCSSTWPCSPATPPCCWSRPAAGRGRSWRPAGRGGPGPARPRPAAGRRGRRAGHRAAGGRGGSTANDWPTWPRATRCSSSRRWATATAPPGRWSGPSWTRCRPRSRPCWKAASVVGPVFDWPSVAALAPEPLGRGPALLLALARRNLIRVADRGAATTPSGSRNGLLREGAYEAIAAAAAGPARPGGRAAGHRGHRRGDDEVVGYHLGQAYRYLAQLAGHDAAPRPRRSGQSQRVPVGVPA